VHDNNEDVARKLASVFIEMGESYVSFIAQGSEVGIQCARVLLLCARHPTKELASHAFKFWYTTWHMLHSIAHYQLHPRTP
jgi:hypothetical protein